MLQAPPMSASTSQLLIIDPPTELRFRGPFREVVTTVLKLSNPTDRTVFFKIKTTAPKRYCVRPNSGTIFSGETAEIAVMLQPFEFDPTEKAKHKFMVQSMFKDDDSDSTVEEAWRTAGSHKIADSKLKCVFDMPSVDHSAQQAAYGAVPTTGVDDQNAVMQSSAASFGSMAGSGVGGGSGIGTGSEGGVGGRVEDDFRNVNQRLWVDNQRLKSENEKLKTEGLRLRNIALQDTVGQAPKVSYDPANSSLKLSSNKSIPAFVYALIFFALILGIIVGKTFF